MLFEFNEALLNASTCMKKTITVGKDRKDLWFDKECTQSKRELRHILRHCYKQKDDEIARNNYNQKRREYKELLRSKRKDHRAKIVNTLHENVNNPSVFWGKIKSYSTNTNVQNNITKEEWHNHFSNVFQSELADDLSSNTVNDVQNESQEPLPDINTDSLECNISEREVYAAVRALKKITKRQALMALSVRFLKTL